MLEDVKIIELFFARTEQAIAELAAKYGSTCKRIANNILKCEPDAEECVNDTYLAAWNAIPPERPDPLRTYILCALFLDNLRGNTQQNKADSEESELYA